MNALESLWSSFHRKKFLGSDPLQFAHRFHKSTTQEIVAFFSACFAYGSAKQICKNLELIFAKQGLLEGIVSGKMQFSDFDAIFSGVYYRFHKSGHFAVVAAVLSQISRKHGSLGASVFAQWQSVPENSPDRFADLLHHFSENFLSQGKEILTREGRLDLWPGLRFLFNSPRTGSACKRWCMFFRWMVRKDKVVKNNQAYQNKGDYFSQQLKVVKNNQAYLDKGDYFSQQLEDSLDLGLWPWIPANELVIPLDTHVSRISFLLRLRQGKENQNPSWKMAKEVTSSLKAFDSDDPVRFDFALARLGILEICKKKYQLSICKKCPAIGQCRYTTNI